MSAISLDRIVSIEAKRHELSDAMAAGNLSTEDFVRLSKEYAQIEPVAAAAREVRRLRAERDSLMAMTKDADEELREIASVELTEIEAALPLAERALALQLLPKDSADERAAMLEVRAGTGGDEAALFAGDLLRMYQRFAEESGWKFELINASQSDVGGYKEAVASITGNGVFARLKFESGVHRVQRVPVTESGGRIHTSAATVAVLPEAEEIAVEIDPLIGIGDRLAVGLAGHQRRVLARAARHRVRADGRGGRTQPAARQRRGLSHFSGRPRRRGTGPAWPGDRDP